MTRLKTPEAAKDLLARYGNILTIFTAALVIIVGFTLLENPSATGTAALVISLLFLLAFLFLYARVVIKGVIVGLLSVLAGAWAFQLGALTGNPFGGTIWMTSFLGSLAFCLGVSYLHPTPKGRWGPLALSAFAGFFSTYLLLTLAPLPIGALVGALVIIATFLLFYYRGRKARVKKDAFPATSMAVKTYEEIKGSLLPRTYGVRLIEKKGEKAALVWNNQGAFVLLEAAFEAQLSLMEGPRRRSAELGYRGARVTPWLTSLVNRFVPAWGLRGATPLLVLLDLENGNGKEPRVVGVPVADSSQPLVVGIFPARRYLAKRDYLGLLEELQREFSPFMTPLKEKQVKALDRLLPVTLDEEGEAPPKVPPTPASEE